MTKQGRKGRAPYKGYSTSTEGSNWIIECAGRDSDQPLWVLVWGGLEDVAQALHDAPEIESKIRVYWIGGPNKKWSANSYAYIAANFPDLWFIEVNSSYYGFFSRNVTVDSLKNDNYYNSFIGGRGSLGRDFRNHYDGRIKMGDTPSVFYVLHGDPNDPQGESWGGSFEPTRRSSRIVFDRNTTLEDTVTVCSVVEFHFQGPEVDISTDSACFTMTVQAGIGEQKWEGYYLGEGEYAIKYAPKQTEALSYTISSDIPGFPVHSGEMMVDNLWPGQPRSTDYLLGANWYTDKGDAALYDGTRQGAITVLKYRNDALLDWAERWQSLKN